MPTRLPVEVCRKQQTMEAKGQRRRRRALRCRRRPESGVGEANHRRRVALKAGGVPDGGCYGLLKARRTAAGREERKEKNGPALVSETAEIRA